MTERFIGLLLIMTEWSYGEGMTEELDCMLRLIETRNEARCELPVTQHFFCDDGILQR